MRRLALTVLLLGVVACRDDTPGYRPVAVGEPAPAYGAPTLAGDSVSLADLGGDAVLLNVWATWCPPCRDEMPGLQALHERYGQRGLRVVAVSIDARGAEGAIDDFVREYGLSFTILHDVAETVSRDFRLIGVPETFLIQPDGRIAYRWIGKFDPLADDVLQRVEAVLPAR
ncbi:MAG TPA: TlpA disulfide reductase family protein [Longimicrobiales bacterium]|nr:TlpA disulfide reductase family protein [Longimicrobiales bacterium]